MTKREAKKVACRMASHWLQSDLGSGCVSSSFLGECLTHEEESKVEEALEELIGELVRRGYNKSRP